MRKGRRADGLHGATSLPALSEPQIKLRPGTEADVDAIAQLWAEATAARDGDPDVAGLELSRPLILEATSKPNAVSMLAVDGDRVVAFALAHAEDAVPKVQYVAAAPDHWGRGNAGRVLDALVEQLRDRGYPKVRLNVYTDNAQAMRLYERHGWIRAPGPAKPHSRTGKPEYTYTRQLGPSHSIRSEGL